MKQEIQSSKFIAKHIDLVCGELRHLGIVYETSNKITVLKNKLKEHNKNRKEKEFEQKNGIPAIDTDLDLLHVKPLYLPAAGWGEAYIG